MGAPIREMETIVAHATDFLGKSVDWAVGGFHLMYANGTKIEESIQSRENLGVRFVVPTHCTGDEAVAAFRRAYGSHCVPAGAGRQLVLDKDVLD